MTTTTASTAQTFRVQVASHFAANGRRASGHVRVVQAADKAEAAELALAGAVADDRADLERSQADAARLGGSARSTLFEWKVEAVRKAPARRA